jgi:hypothetical protein
MREDSRTVEGIESTIRSRTAEAIKHSCSDSKEKENG